MKLGLEVGPMENLLALNSAWLHCGSSIVLQSPTLEDSRTCPVCFVLMKPPHLAPIILTPCGHTFCAKCIAVHTAVQRKKARIEGGLVRAPPCPCCKKAIVAQGVNIPLQNIIMERLAIDESIRQAEMESTYPKTPMRGHLLYEELLAPQDADLVTRLPLQGTREKDMAKCCGALRRPLCSQSLQDALQEMRHRQDRLEMDLSSADNKLNCLDTKEKELKHILQKVSLEYQMVQSELEDTRSKKDMLHQAYAETLKKSKLIKAYLVAFAIKKPY